MSQYEVQNLRYSSRGGYVCWPKVVSNERAWDPRASSKWSIEIDSSKVVDLIGDAGFSEGDIITPWINVAAGVDSSARKNFIVTSNNKTAGLDASGTIVNSHLAYTGTS